jgi:hypothetical protein
MSIAIQSIQAVNEQAQTQQAAQAPKSTQATTQTAVSQDKITISPQARQALANHTKASAKG